MVITSKKSMTLTLAKQPRRHKAVVKNRLPEIFVMTDERRLPDPVAVARSIPRTWGLIFRHYGSHNREVLATQTAHICRARGILFFVAGDWRLADRVRADGVHMPEGLTGCNPQAPLWLWQRRGKLVSMSAHGAKGLRRTRLFKTDAAVLSPVEATESHSDGASLGCLRFSALARSIPVPVYALGGMTLAHLKRMSALGAAGVAGIGIAQTVS